MTNKKNRMKQILCIVVIFVCIFLVGVISVKIIDSTKKIVGGGLSEKIDVSNEKEISNQHNVANCIADLKGEYPSEVLNGNDKLVCRNDEIALFYDEKSMIMKVQDLANNYVWSSTMDLGMESLSSTWKEFARSLLVVEMIDSGTIKSKQYQPDFPDKGYVTRYNDKGFEVDVTFSDIKLAITMKFSLSEQGLSVEIPDNLIKYDSKEEKKLSKMYVLPFFGAAYKDTYPGYMFVPDGSGALIRYEKPGVYSNAYKEYIFGKDYSINASVLEAASEETNDYLGEITPYSVGMPVFGVAHGANQNAFLGRINNGAEYCQLHANPAGNLIDFYWIAPQFVFREIYWVSDQAGLGFNVMQKQANTVNAQLTYSFLADEKANYVGMANNYKQQLLDEELLPANTKVSEQIPLYVDALMGEAVESLWGYKVETMTKVSDINKWIYTLNKNGINNLIISMRGIEPKGYSARSVRSFKVNKSIGSVKQLDELSERLKKSDGLLTVSKDYTKIYDVQAKTNDPIYSIERRYTLKHLNAPLFDEVYFLNLPTAAELINEWEKQSLYYNNISLDSMGTILYSNYKKDSEYDRTQALKMTCELLQNASEQTDNLCLQNPNEYAFKYSDKMYDIPVNHSQYFFETDCVPFLQIVMSGRVPLFSETMNENVSDRDVTLRLIEFNTYPTYTFTEGTATVLVDSNSRDIFGSKAELMLPLAIKQYKQINQILSHTVNLQIVSRTVPEDDVVIIEYEDDTTVIVNYNNHEIIWDGHQIAKKDAVLLVGGEVVVGDE